MAATAKPVSSDLFSNLMQDMSLDLRHDEPLAVAVSGGGDSMALLLLLNRWAQQRGHLLYAVTVDHALRPESRGEAEAVSVLCQTLGVHHSILTWEGDKPATRIQERARQARYDLLAAFCRERGIRYLAVAHNIEDQAETILFRLAKGSGLDGLSGMQPVSDYDDMLHIIRPLLLVHHQDLLATCTAHDTEWIEDPSNQNPRYARVRMRNSLQLLSEEGLSPERLAVLGARLGRASEVINQVLEKEWKNISLYNEPKRIETSFLAFKQQPEEIAIRLLMKIFAYFATDAFAHLRLEEVERLCQRIRGEEQFKGATLSGCYVRVVRDLLIVSAEG